MNSGSEITKPVRLRDRLREATAAAILDAAEQVFAADGPKARMESIAARAGIAVGTLYNHFQDREALWDALRRSRRQALLSRLDAALEAQRGRPFATALRAFLDALAAHWAQHRGFLTVVVNSEPTLQAPAPGARRERTMVEELVSRAATLVRRGVAEGALREEGHELFPSLLMGMMRAVVVSELARQREMGELLDRVVEMFLFGAGRRP